MKNKLINFCKSINIEYTGIAPAGPYHDFEKIWRKQLDRGYISGFEEKDIEKRVYPHLTLEDCKSVIVCLFPYLTKAPENTNLTKSAFSIDYHHLVKEKLNKIAKFLESRIDNFNYKAFVDNGPFSDRYLAYKAGLGFWGINNSIITDKYGSYVFIGYIINNYPFEPGTPQERTCIKCFKCVRACPGQCINGDFTINPQRCKSYLTQKKGELTSDEKNILTKTNLIWGCDVCQDVCPHNEGAQETILEEFKTNLLYRLEPEELRELSNREFREKYGNRSFSWRGKNILIRNHQLIKK